MERVFNFSAGPAVLPETVLKQAAAEMLDYGGTGTSVMEMSHRSKAFIDIHARAESDLLACPAFPSEEHPCGASPPLPPRSRSRAPSRHHTTSTAATAHRLDRDVIEADCATPASSAGR